MSTADGVKAIDVARLAANRPEIAEDPQVLTCAPEICVEIFSPSNSLSEINEKRTLYFDAGAAEVWVCAVDGSISFFVSPHHQSPASSFARASLTASRDLPSRLRDRSSVRLWCGFL